MSRKKIAKSDLNDKRDKSVTKAYLELSEIKRLKQAATNQRDLLLIQLLSQLGGRITEILSLKTEDIDFSAGMITILHLKMRLKLSCPDCGARLGKSHTYCPKCGSKVEKIVSEEQEHRRVRSLPVDDETLKMLKNYIERGGPVNRKGQMLLFGINRHRAWQIIKECADRAGLPKLVNTETGRVHNISPHKLRDAFAVHAVKINDSGDGLRLLQQYLGHSNFNTTARYRKVSGEEQRDWYQKLWKEDKP